MSGMIIQVHSHENPMLEADKVTRDAGKLEHLHRFLPGEIESMFRWMMFGFKLSNEKRAPGCLGLGGEILPSDVGIIVSHSRDPYQTTSIMENKRVFSGFKLVLPSNQQEWPRMSDVSDEFSGTWRQNLQK